MKLKLEEKDQKATSDKLNVRSVLLTRKNVNMVSSEFNRRKEILSQYFKHTMEVQR